METIIAKNQHEKLIPVLSKKDKEDLYAYYTVYEKYADEFEKNATENLKDHPVFGKLIRDIPKEVSEANNNKSKALQKDAIFNNNWEPYVKYQIEQGITYARMGLDFKSWYEVIVLVKNYIGPLIHKEYRSTEKLFSALSGMSQFMDIAMCIIGEAYLEEKQEIIKNEQTKIKLLNYELAKSEKLFRTMIEKNAEMITLALPDGKIIYISPSLTKVLGFTAEEYISRPGIEFIHPEDLPGLMEGIMDILKTPGKTLSRTHRLLHKDGTYRWCEGTITNMLHDPDVGALVSNFRDITAKKESDEKLIASEEQFRKTLDNMLEGAQIIDFDWRYVYVNDTLVKHAKYSREEMIGFTVMEKFPGIEQTPTYKLYKRCFDERIPFHVENEFEFPDKSKGWFELSFQPIPDGIFILSIDITERKKAEEEINQLNSSLEIKVKTRTTQLEAVNKELEAFSYSVSHDLRAPLRAINGYAEILNEDYGSKIDEEGTRILGNIKYYATKMGTLIDDLLAFSRLGRKEIQKTWVDMNELTEGVLREINKSISHKAKININKLHRVKADYGLIYQVMFNLISNAVKYSSKKDYPILEITSLEKNGEIIFSIKDNGVGFNMKYAANLFGVFQRLHSTEEFEGTGVGLAIVKRIITRHDGRIWAEGKVNEGATFNFSLTKK